MTCCNDQRPRISERTGRMFCANCRQFLDAQPVAPSPSRDEEITATNANTSPETHDLSERQIELGFETTGDDR